MVIDRAGELGGGEPTELCGLIVLYSKHLGLQQRVELLLVEQLIAKATVEAPDIWLSQGLPGSM